MTTYSGDVTLTGSATPPISLANPEDVYVHPDSIAGDLELHDVEYVFTATPIKGGASVDDVETNVTGSIEDGYVEPDGVDGDLQIVNAEDVFIGHDAVAGACAALGPEQVFDTGTTEPPSRDPATYDVRVSGWEQTRTVEDPDVGVLVAGSRADVTITDASGHLALYLIGTEHSVSVDGEASVELHIVGRDTTVDLAPYIDIDRAVETGFDNDVTVEPVPYEDLIETTKDEAYGRITIGRAKVTYQTPARDETWCNGCGKEAETIIRRHQEDAFFLFGIPLKTFASGSRTQECEHCAERIDASLSAAEREEIFGR
ncbi:hypothetical protein [Halarchaeum sp. P4]|uniref:hypothetical protein n=1 Tax=Halarchaeum sp. P4 TaxID=3421639 RepID=UPI003EBE7B94